MRLFAALPLPAPAQEGAARVLEELRGLAWPVRWVRPEGLHITLKFFGEVMPERLEIIAEMIGFAVEGLAPVTLAVAGAGAFPDLDHPRVLRLDLSGATDQLALLQDRLERGGLGIGFPPEGRPFHPHITLGRVKEGQRLPPDAVARLQRVNAQGSFLADRLVLFESHLTETGPRYEARGEWEFRP